MTDIEDLFEDEELGDLDSVPPGWEELWEQETAKPYWKELMCFVKKEYVSPNRIHQDVYPPEDRVFRVFRMCRPENIKAVILGQDPYHEKEQADGLAFSYSGDGKIPPSLRNIFGELMGKNNLDYSSDLSGWVEKGVFLLNSILTVREGKALSHAGKGWEIFTTEVIKFITKKKAGICFILWGKYAQEKEQYIERKLLHHIIRSSHPSPLSARRRCGPFPPFLGSGCFESLETLTEINLLDCDAI